MDKNFDLWFDNNPELEEWQRQMVAQWREAYQAYLDERVEELAEYYNAT